MPKAAAPKTMSEAPTKPTPRGIFKSRTGLKRRKVRAKRVAAACEPKYLGARRKVAARRDAFAAAAPGAAGGVFRLIIVKSYLRHDLDDVEGAVANDRAGQLFAGNIALANDAVAIGPVVSEQLLRRMFVVLGDDENADARALSQRFDDV